MEKTKITRKFYIESKKVTLADPDPVMTPDQVMQFYSNTYPELVTSSVHGPKYEGDSIVFTFKTTVGTKG